MRDSLLPHGDGVSISLSLLSFPGLCVHGLYILALVPSLHTGMDTLLFLVFCSSIPEDLYTAQYG